MGLINTGKARGSLPGPFSSGNPPLYLLLSPTRGAKYCGADQTAQMYCVQRAFPILGASRPLVSMVVLVLVVVLVVV